MTDAETLEIAALAKGLLPRTTDDQAALFRKEVAPFEFRSVSRILQQFAMEAEEQRLHLPRVMYRIRAADTETVRRKVEEETRAADEARRAEAVERQRVEQNHEEMRRFCEAHAGEVEGWRAELVERMPWLASFAKRPTLGSPLIMGVIYQTYGGVEHEQGGGQ